MPKYVDTAVTSALKKQDKKKKLKGILKKISFGYKNPSPGSVGERVSTAIKNKQNFKALIKAGRSPEDARESFESDAERQRMIRTEYERQMKIRKKKKK